MGREACGRLLFHLDRQGLDAVAGQLVLGAVHGVEVVVGADHDPVLAVAAVQIDGLNAGLEAFQDQFGPAAVRIFVAAEAAGL